MTIQSLGVGSGLALDDLVKQLLDAESKPKTERLDSREKENEAEISGLGKLKSQLSTFKEALDDLRRDETINSREPTIKNPSEDTDIFTAEASNSALTGDYEIAVTQLASGSRIETAKAVDGGFSASTDSVLSSGSGSLTFKIGNTGDSFNVNVTAGMTLAQLREAINSNENNFGVNANIITTGTTDGGAKLVFTSDVTGAGNDLVIVNNDNLADLQRVSTTDSGETLSYLTPVKNAENAIAEIDGIEVQSSTNEFENTIQNVSFTAETLSPLDALGDPITSKMSIGYDKEGTEEKIRKFVETFNKMKDELANMTKYGESELEDDGVFAGDSMIRGINNGLANILSQNVSTSALGGLYQLGISFDEDGKLEISDIDIGLGSGEDRLETALEDYFDDVAKLFTDPDEGIAQKMYDYVHTYTRSGGLIQLRENEAKEERDSINDDRERLELRLLNYEQILRDKYLNLDQTVARLNQTGSALLAALG